MAFEQPFYRWRPHPWHGIEPGPRTPEVVQTYVEITPFDLVKYEVDKTTGYVRVDRPQQGASQPPTLYGFVPQTYCGPRVAGLFPGAERGDGDPLDICVLSERPIARAEIIVDARVIGGLQILDDGEADDKIIGVLAQDPIWSSMDDITDLPDTIVDRLRHYFETYKMAPGAESVITIRDVYGREHAHDVIRASLEDYEETFGK